MIIEILKISLITYMFYALQEEGMIFSWYARIIENLPGWAWRPLGGCFMCLTGQVLFWAYLFLHIEEYNLIDHLFYPSFGIIMTNLYDFIYEKIKSN